MTNWNTILRKIGNVLYTVGAVLYVGVAAVIAEPIITAGSITPEAYWYLLGVISVFGLMVLMPVLMLVLLAGAITLFMDEEEITASESDD